MLNKLPINIRAATFDDLQKIVEIKIDDQSMDVYAKELFLREFKKRWAYRLQESVSLLILCDENLCGFASCSALMQIEGFEIAKIDYLYVIPSMRRLGLGSQLCLAVLDKLRAKNFRWVEVWLPKCSEQILHFYERNGFRETGNKRQEIIREQSVINEVLYRIDLKIT